MAKSKELASDYARLKPWFLTVSIAVIEAKRMGFEISEGLDRHFVVHESLDDALAATL